MKHFPYLPVLCFAQLYFDPTCSSPSFFSRAVFLAIPRHLFLCFYTFVFWQCPWRAWSSFVCPSGQILLSRYLMNTWTVFDKTDMKYLLALIDDLIGFWRSKVKVTASRRGGGGIAVDAGKCSPSFGFSVAWLVSLQIHVLEDGSVHVFSRNQEDNTNKYPDIVHRMQAIMSGLGQSVTSAVIDSEAVAWDRQQNCILPFQELSKRKRKVLALTYLVTRHVLDFSSRKSSCGQICEWICLIFNRPHSGYWQLTKQLIMSCECDACHQM